MTGLTNAVGGIAGATPLAPLVTPVVGAVNGLVSNLLPDGQGGPVSSLLSGLGLGGLLGTVKGTVAGLPIAGPLLSGILNNLNSVPGAGNMNLEQLQTLLGAARTAPDTGLSLIANLGGGRMLTSAGTIVQLPLGSDGDATSALGSAVSDTAGSVLAQMPGGLGNAVGGGATIPINTAQGIVNVPLSLLNGALGTAQGFTGLVGGASGAVSGATQQLKGAGAGAGLQGLLGGVTGLGGTLVNVGGRLLPLSEVLGLLSGATSNTAANPLNLVGLSSPPSDDNDADDSTLDAEIVSSANGTMSYSSMEPASSMGSSTYQNPYPSADPSGTPSVTQLVESMIARGMPTEKLSVSPVAAASGVAPSGPSVSMAAPTSMTSSVPVPSADSVKVPIPSSALAALPSTSAKPPVKGLEAEAEDEGSDDGYESGDDDDDELWGDFVDGN